MPAYVYRLVSLLGLCTGLSMAMAVEPELVSPLNPRATYYRENAGNIDALRAKVLDTSTHGAERLSGLEELQLRYRYAAVATAGLLIADPQLEIAELAAKILSNALVMSDHPHADHEPAMSLAMQQHIPAREALRKAVLDTRPSVRDIAASLLTSISDSPSLELIDQGVKKDLYSPVQAVNYYGLAKPDISAAYIEPYLAGPNVVAQTAAVTYLGSNPNYQQMIKERFLDGAGAADPVRTAAANSLGRFDPQFPSYAEIVLRDKTLPPTAFEAIAKRYIATVDDRPPAARMQAIDGYMKKYLQSNPNADLSGLQRQLQILK